MRSIAARTNNRMAFEASLRGLHFNVDQAAQDVDAIADELTPEQEAAIDRAHLEAQQRVLKERYGK